ncbi:putative metalloendopeptidase [Martiniozyma asiatica (nom. inval.)]|nr:putative metalloendopeptidase [Martiniozyma asiatica]
MTISFENLPKENENLPVPVIILKGHSSSKSDGIIGAFNDNFPPQFYPVTNGYFKAYLHLGQGMNTIKLKHLDGGFRVNGYAQFDQSKDPIDEKIIKINYEPLDDTLFKQPLIHMCVLVAKDSPMLFDCPSDKLFEGNGIETSIRKLRIGGRLMQAFTIDEMSKNGLGNRCFRFVEEITNGTTSYQDEMNNVKRSEIKIHIIKCNQTVKEIRDANYAQQNKNAKEAGKLFDITLNALTQYGGVFSDAATSSVPAMAAVMILDAHWDVKQNLILGHAALGGGTDRIKLAIFGSQGLHSWPMNWESVQKAFTDCTKLNTKEVANDCNECGQYWECLCVSLGAFMHEIGHSLGCPHQEHGVMLRDYVTMNRKFLTFEQPCLRTNKNAWGPVLTKDEPGWHRLDVLRFLYHPAFTLASDLVDEEFKPAFSLQNEGMRLPPGVNAGPTFSALDDHTLQIYSDTGVYLVEIFIGEWSRIHYEYIPRSLGGIAPQRSVRLDYNIIQQQLAPQWRNKPIKLDVLCAGLASRSIDNLSEYLKNHSTYQIFNTPFGQIKARKSDKFGLHGGKDIVCAFPSNKKLIKIRVTHGLALDGVRFVFDDGSVADFGNFKSHYSDFDIANEKIIAVEFRAGAWIDGIRFITDKKQSPWFGGNGGSIQHVDIVGEFKGLWGVIGDWVNQIGVLNG